MKKSLTLLSCLMASLVVAGCNEPVANNSDSVNEPVISESESAPVESAPSESTPETPSDTPSENPSEPDTPVVPQVTLDFNFEEDVEIEIYTTLSATSNYGICFDDYLDKFMTIYPNMVDMMMFVTN